MIITYFIFFLALFGTKLDTLFHLTVLIFLISITRNFYDIYRKNKNVNTGLILTAFFILFLAHLVYLLPTAPHEAIGNLMELVSFLILLFLIIRILRQGKTLKL